MVEIHNLIQPGLEQIFLPALSTFFRSHPDIRCCFATSIESRRQRQINLQANLCPTRQNWQKRILTASENRFPLKRLRVLHGRLTKMSTFPNLLIASSASRLTSSSLALSATIQSDLMPRPARCSCACFRAPALRDDSTILAPCSPNASAS